MWASENKIKLHDGWNREPIKIIINICNTEKKSKWTPPKNNNQKKFHKINVSFQKANKIGKFLARMIKIKGQKVETNNIRNEKGTSLQIFSNIEHIGVLYELLYANKYENGLEIPE